MEIRLKKAEKYLKGLLQTLIDGNKGNDAYCDDERDEEIREELFLSVFRMEIPDYFGKKYNNEVKLSVSFGHPYICFEDHKGSRLHDEIIRIRLNFTNNSISYTNYRSDKHMLKSDSSLIKHLNECLLEFIQYDEEFKEVLFEETISWIRKRKAEVLLQGENYLTRKFQSLDELEKFVRKYQDPEESLEYFWFEGVLFECWGFDEGGKEVFYIANEKSPKQGNLWMLTEDRYGVFGMTDAEISYFI